MEERPSKALSRSLTRTFTINKPVTTPVQTPTSSDYKHQYDQITHVIEGMNEKLADKFHRRESEVLDSYKSELQSLQRELAGLKDNTNEEGLRRRLMDKKQILERERTQHLELSMFFSGKCEVFKEKVSKIVKQNKDLEAEIRYLEEKVNKPIRNAKQKTLATANNVPPYEQEQQQGFAAKSNSRKGRLLNELRKVGHGKHNGRLRQSKESQLISVASVVSPHQDRSHQLEPNQSRSPINFTGTPERSRKKLKVSKLKQLLEDPLLRETEFERLFLQSISKIKEKKAAKGSNLPQIRRAQSDSIEDDPAESTTVKISDSDLNDFDKRTVVEDFLSREEVKHYFYGLLFGRQSEPTFLRNVSRPEVFDKPF